MRPTRIVNAFATKDAIYAVERDGTTWIRSFLAGREWRKI